MTTIDAVAMLDASLSFIPVDHKTKRARGKWKQYQTRPPTRAEVDSWQRAGHKSFAVIGGAISGGLEIIDIDDNNSDGTFLGEYWTGEAVYQRWYAKVGDVVEMYNLPVQWTPGGGYQCMYRRESGTVAGNRKLAHAPDDDPENKTGRLCIIETRGEGGYALVPDALHPNGGRYKLIQGQWPDVPTIPDDVADMFAEAAIELDEMPHTRQELAALARTPTEKRGNATDDNDNVIAAYNKKNSVPALLEDNGYIRHSPTLYSRPGKPDSKGVHIVEDVAFCWSSNDPLNLTNGAGKPLPIDAFEAYTFFSHNGDHRAAYIEAKKELGLWTESRTNGDGPPSMEEPPAWLDEDEDHGQAGAIPPLRGPHHLTELGNARRLVDKFGHDVHYVYSWGRWLIWDGTRWLKDQDGGIDRLAKKTVASIYEEAGRAIDDDGRKKIAKFAMRSESQKAIKAMIGLAMSEPGIPANHDDLDGEPMLINARNGTINMATGELLPHDRSKLITKRIEVDFDPNATCPLWDKFLNRIMAEDDDMIQFLRRAIGYSLTANTSERALFFMYGSGANGKSTFVETLMHIFGDYSQKAPTEMLMIKYGSPGIPNDVARLQGARFVVAAELPDGRRFNEELLKDLTGNDTLTARYMRQEYFDFKASHKLWMYGNHKPIVKGTDDGIWSRFRLIPFSVTIPEDEKDTSLPDRLLLEAPGILAWAVEGARAWATHGLQTPDAVIKATAGYRAQMDVIGAFIDDACILGANFHVKFAELYKAYTEWCEASNERAIKKRAFGDLLTERGFSPDNGAKNVAIRWGLGLKQ